MKRKRNAGLAAGAAMFFIILFVMMFAGLLAPNDPNKIDMALRFAPASAQMPLGGDAYGRCVLSRLLYGARYSMGLAALIMGIVAALAVPIGIAATYAGGIADRLFLLTCDISMAMPPTVLVLAIMGILGNGTGNLIFSAIFSYWGWYGRMIRSYTLTELGKGYVVYAKTGSTSGPGILLRHILPNIAPSLIVLLALGVGDVILMVSGFSFLGIGLPAGAPEWGAMLAESKSLLLGAPQFAVYPGLCVLFSVCAFNLFGEGLRARLSPYRKGVDYE